MPWARVMPIRGGAMRRISRVRVFSLVDGVAYSLWG